MSAYLFLKTQKTLYICKVLHKKGLAEARLLCLTLFFVLLHVAYV